MALAHYVGSINMDVHSQFCLVLKVKHFYESSCALTSRLYTERCVNGGKKGIGYVLLTKFLEQPCETPTGSMIVSLKTETHASQTQS